MVLHHDHQNIDQHQQNIQMRNHNLMLMEMLASTGFNVYLHILDIPDILSITKISTISASDKTHPSTYEHLHRNSLTQNEPKNKTVP